VAAIAATLGSGCPSDDDADDHDDGHGNGGHHDGGQIDPDEMVRCPDDVPELSTGETAGLAATSESGEVMARVIAADHVPAKKFLNTWTIALTNADGTPLEDVEIVKACAFMPVHGHGLPPRKINVLSEGRVELENLNFTMRGPWEVQLALASGDQGESGRATDCDPSKSGSDYVELHVCVTDE
jgi:hypothetical protein